MNVLALNKPQIIRFMKNHLFLAVIVSIITVSCNSDPLVTDEDIMNAPLGIGSFFGPTYSYRINLSFSDQSGNDLIDEEEWSIDGKEWTNNKLYSLSLEYSHPDAFPHDIPGVVYYDKHNPEFTMQKYNSQYHMILRTQKGKYYLNHHCGYSKTGGLDIALACGTDDYIKDNPLQDYIIYKLTCPILFGDNSVHELITYWDDDLCFPYDSPEALEQLTLYPHCYKALFDGKEVLVNAVPRQTNREYYDYYIDIVLDK